jgi:hypothetical protein
MDTQLAIYNNIHRELVANSRAFINTSPSENIVDAEIHDVNDEGCDCCTQDNKHSWSNIYRKFIVDGVPLILCVDGCLVNNRIEQISVKSAPILTNKAKIIVNRENARLLFCYYKIFNNPFISYDNNYLSYKCNMCYDEIPFFTCLYYNNQYAICRMCDVYTCELAPEIARIIVYKKMLIGEIGLIRDITARLFGDLCCLRY